MIEIPQKFSRGIMVERGEAGADWVLHLPGLVNSLCDRWELIPDGSLMHGHLAIAVPVRRSTQSLMLKVSWMDGSTRHESQALKAWNGLGAVHLFESDLSRGAMLLERLDGSRELTSVPIIDALSIAGRLLRRLAIPMTHEFPRISAHADEIVAGIRDRWQQLGGPMPRSLMEEACETGLELADSSDSLLVDYDLHYGNILAAEREPWLAIDPKVVVADAEYGVAQLLWTRLEDLLANGGLIRGLDHLIEVADLDRVRTRRWTLFRCVEYWMWGLTVGLTENPKRCRYIVESLSQ